MPEPQLKKPCRRCLFDKNIEDFPFFSTSTAGRKNTCKECSNELSQIRAKLKSQNPPPQAGPCPICRRHTEAWVLDHSHFTSRFRGYICNDCNLGLGKFNDDILLLYSAIAYLAK